MHKVVLQALNAKHLGISLANVETLVPLIIVLLGDVGSRLLIT